MVALTVLALVVVVVLAAVLVALVRAVPQLVATLTAAGGHQLAETATMTRSVLDRQADVHAQAMRDAMEALRSSIDSFASTMRPPVGAMPLEVADDTDVMAGLVFPDVIPDWTDGLIPSDDDRPDAIMFDPAVFDPAAEIGLRS